jgi:hypothetical protein
LSAAIKTGGVETIPSSCFDTLKLERYSKGEVLLLLTQAKLQRRAAVLFLHRLWYPFGEEDKEAEDISRSIVNDLEHCLDVAGQLPPHITLVFLVAATKVHDAIER